MSLDVTLRKMMPTEVYSRNITHNLGKMANQVKLSSGETLYDILWRPDECNPAYKKAEELIPWLGDAITDLIRNPEKYKKFNPENGWGSYEGLIEFVSAYHHACVLNPDADIEVCR